MIDEETRNGLGNVAVQVEALELELFKARRRIEWLESTRERARDEFDLARARIKELEVVEARWIHQFNDGVSFGRKELAAEMHAWLKTA